MAGEHQVQITALFKGTGGWLGEVAQCSWRMAYVPVPLVPGKGQQFTPQPANMSAQMSDTGANATWRWADSWRAEWGADSWGHDQNLEVGTALTTYWTAVKAYVAPYYSLAGFKTSLIKPDGKFAYGSSAYELIAPVPGAASSAAPPELSVCTTLRAPVLGRRGRGRWYLPGFTTPQATVDEGKVKSTFRQSMVTAGKALVVALEAVGDPYTDFQPLVAVGSATSATMYRPAQIRCGDHYDVQRRRQHQVPENYTTEAL